ncbi:ABC transporter substrate-binding protein [Mycobacterium sp. 852013-50091_SCH5140682]|uniref:ABC transporter substrate-binding protein n=1 Tax=Mycobacterium sp. 852013-50091_SCH5140682 TaxID=1834109 RepID=UPI0009ED36ED|nr:ABC transporter substrate-binding protein [Mycobacterium sp. 852013-50091_SCH5140682]
MTDGRRRSGTRILAWPIVVCAAALVAACGGGAPSQDSASTTASVDGALPADVPSAVSIGVGAPLGTLDPNRAVADVDVMALSLIAGTLVEQSPEGGVRPSLAKECTLAGDGLSYACELRPGLKFSDGSPLTGTDVVATFTRALADEANANAGLIAPLLRVTTAGESTVVFHLKYPAASFPLALSEPLLGIYPAGRMDTPGFFVNPVSAGAYRLDRAVNSEIAFTKNAEYPSELAPVIDKIVFRVVVDANTRLMQLQTGQLDIAHQLPANLAAQVTRPAEAYVASRYGSVFLEMNNKSGPLRDVKVRKAISAAINRDQINDIAYLGRNKPLGGFLPSSMEGHDPNAPTAQDLPKARELLRGTECEAGCTLEIMQKAGFPPYDTVAQIIQQNLAAIGIKVNINTIDASTLAANEQNGNFQLQSNDLWDVVNSPELVMLRYGLTPKGGINSLWSGYDSPTMTRLIDNLSATSGPGQRTALLDQINMTFQQDLPYVPLTDFATTWASRISPRLVALTPSGVYRVGTSQRGPGL